MDKRLIYYSQINWIAQPDYEKHNCTSEKSQTT